MDVDVWKSWQEWTNDQRRTAAKSTDSSLEELSFLAGTHLQWLNDYMESIELRIPNLIQGNEENDVSCHSKAFSPIAEGDDISDDEGNSFSSILSNVDVDIPQLIGIEDTPTFESAVSRSFQQNMTSQAPDATEASSPFQEQALKPTASSKQEDVTEILFQVANSQPSTVIEATQLSTCSGDEGENPPPVPLKDTPIKSVKDANLRDVAKDTENSKRHASQTIHFAPLPQRDPMPIKRSSSMRFSQKCSDKSLVSYPEGTEQISSSFQVSSSGLVSNEILSTKGKDNNKPSIVEGGQTILDAINLLRSTKQSNNPIPSPKPHITKQPEPGNGPNQSLGDTEDDWVPRRSFSVMRQSVKETPGPRSPEKNNLATTTLPSISRMRNIETPSQRLRTPTTVESALKSAKLQTTEAFNKARALFFGETVMIDTPTRIVNPNIPQSKALPPIQDSHLAPSNNISSALMSPKQHGTRNNTQGATFPKPPSAEPIARPSKVNNIPKATADAEKIDSKRMSSRKEIPKGKTAPVAIRFATASQRELVDQRKTTVTQPLNRFGSFHTAQLPEEPITEGKALQPTNRGSIQQSHGAMKSSALQNPQARYIKSLAAATQAKKKEDLERERKAANKLELEKRREAQKKYDDERSKFDIKKKEEDQHKPGIIDASYPKKVAKPLTSKAGPAREPLVDTLNKKQKPLAKTEIRNKRSAVVKTATVNKRRKTDENGVTEIESGSIMKAIKSSVEPGFEQKTPGVSHAMPHVECVKFSTEKIKFADVKRTDMPGDSIELPEIASDFSDDSEMDASHPRKKALALPQWAESPELRQLLRRQANIDPDAIFGPVKSLQMEDIFRHKGEKALARFRPRSSSANWSGPDRLSAQEVAQYAAVMGYKQPSIQ